MKQSKDLNLEKRIFDFCLRFLAGICLLVILTSCSAAVDVPATATSSPTVTATDNRSVTLQSDTPTPRPTCVVKAYTLNLREGPGTSHAVSQILHKGDVLEVLASGAWLKVATRSGTGFVYGKYCQEGE
jgi:uncharacterized protein YgiM (DUF1202 family)